MADADSSAMFTYFSRAMDDTELCLTVQDDTGQALEHVQLDLRDLPNRPDLLARLGPVARTRLLSEAASIRKAH